MQKFASPKQQQSHQASKEVNCTHSQENIFLNYFDASTLQHNHHIAALLFN